MIAGFSFNMSKLELTSEKFSYIICVSFIDTKQKILLYKMWFTEIIFGVWSLLVIGGPNSHAFMLKLVRRLQDWFADHS